MVRERGAKQVSATQGRYPGIEATHGTTTTSKAATRPVNPRRCTHTLPTVSAKASVQLLRSVTFLSAATAADSSSPSMIPAKHDLTHVLTSTLTRSTTYAIPGCKSVSLQEVNGLSSPDSSLAGGKIHTGNKENLKPKTSIISNPPRSTSDRSSPQTTKQWPKSNNTTQTEVTPSHPFR